MVAHCAPSLMTFTFINCLVWCLVGFDYALVKLVGQGISSLDVIVGPRLPSVRIEVLQATGGLG
jgi:hypothetical protein